jgi:zinc protease
MSLYHRRVMRRWSWLWWCLIAVSCSRWGPPMGHLKIGKRDFRFEHGIQVFEAKNGLRVALVPDTRTNLVTVDVRYPVGAAEDPDGRAGLAHLVEHLTFLTRVDKDGPTLSDRLGDDALDFNAWTTADETHYTSTGFAGRLDELLAIEAQRMSGTCDQIDKALFLRERDVVLEEQAQRHGPLDDVQAEIDAAIWGKGHPYGRAIGSREIADATREEACAFMTAHYGPDSAILVVTGNVDVDTMTAAIGKRFGPVARRGGGTRAALPVVELDGGVTRHLADVEEATAIVYFPAPPWGSEQVAPFTMATAYLGAALAHEDSEATWITGTAISTVGEYRARMVAVMVSVADQARLDDAIELVYDKAIGLSSRTSFEGWERMLMRVSHRYLAGYDSFASRGAWIADYLQYTYHQGFFLDEMVAFSALTERDVQVWARLDFTRAGSHVAAVRPSGATGSEARLEVASSSRPPDVATWRTPVDATEATRALVADTARVESEVVDVELANGLRVVLAPDPESPVVDARMIYPVGTAADPADRPGLAYATALLIEPDPRVDDTFSYNKIAWAFENVGTELDFDVSEQTTTFSARGMALFADWHVWTLFFMLDHSKFPAKQVEAMHQAAADGGDPDRDVRSAALREHLFGAGHPYAGAALTGADVRRIEQRDCDGFRKLHYATRGATLVVSGGFDLAQMQQEIEEVYGTWPADAPAAIAEIPAATPAKGPSWIGVRDPDATQADVTVAFATRSSAEDDRAARLVLQQLLQDRVRVAREELGATYGLSVRYYGGTAGGALAISGMLDPERAGDAMKAIVAELARLRDADNDLAEDFVRARRRALAEVLADAAGATATADELAFVGAHHLDVGFFSELATAIGAITLEQLRTIVRGDLAEHRMVVAISARTAVLETIFGALGVSDAELLDAE